MGIAWLALGANLGDPAAQLETAISHLDAHESIVVTQRSSISRTKPWGKTDQPDFLNMVIAIETSLEPQQLLDACLNIEAMMGRQRIEVWGPRLIDIDVIAYDRFEMKSGQLTLPHPYAHARDFVLEPLREIAPETADWVMEVASKTQ